MGYSPSGRLYPSQQGQRMTSKALTMLSTPGSRLQHCWEKCRQGEAAELMCVCCSILIEVRINNLAACVPRLAGTGLWAASFVRDAWRSKARSRSRQLISKHFKTDTTSYTVKFEAASLVPNFLLRARAPLPPFLQTSALCMLLRTCDLLGGIYSCSSWTSSNMALAHSILSPYQIGA